MGHVDEGEAELPLQSDQLRLHARHQMRIERRQRLVQQHARFGHQRSRERHPLLLAAGQIRNVAAGKFSEAQAVKPLLRSLASLDFRDVHHSEFERDILDHIQKWEERQIAIFRAAGRCRRCRNPGSMTVLP